MPVELARISSFQLETLAREKTVFFFPVGPLEDHGSHLPLGLDVAEAHQLCLLASEVLESSMPGWVGVLMPAAPLGIDTNTTKVAITVRPHVLRDWLVDSCSSLKRLGFYHFVCFSGQISPRQLTAIEDAGRIINSRQWVRGFFRSPRVSFVSASSALVKPKEVLRSPLWPDPEEHGGCRDTSVALKLGQVAPHYRTLPIQARTDSKWARGWKRRTKALSGYWGDPAQASFQQGEEELRRYLEQVFPKLRAVWEGSNPNFLFRSWYSILPPNKSFFKAWMLIIGLGLIVGLWAYMDVFSILDGYE